MPLALWGASVERAEVNAVEAEALVVEQQRELAEWRRRQQDTRERLAAWVGRQR